jgi:transposase
MATCLRYLGKKETWHEVERQSGLRLIRVYDLDTGWMRLDATVGKVYHNPAESSLFRVGKAKNGLYETQFRLMLTSLDLLGLPLVVDVEPGNRADDPLYIPSYLRAKATVARSGVFVVGDSKMGALLTQGTIVAGQDFYLTPLTKDDPELLGQLLKTWLAAGAESTPIFRPEDESTDGSDPDPNQAIAHGFEVTREQEVEVEVNGEKTTWTERLLVVRSYSYLKSQAAGLQHRLDKAEAALRNLTPPRGRDKKQIQEKALLLSRIEQIEARYRVKGYFHYNCQEEVEKKTVRGYKGQSPR